MRLMLVEFFRGALRRNERSMLYPFLQGLARERGLETLWLCYGGDLAHREGASPGRTLFASLPAADLRSLGAHLRKFRPTHVASNDLLSPEAEALLARLAPDAKRLVMPMSGELPGGSARFSAEGDHARCGWFLEWLGLDEGEAEGRYLVEAARPDYAAVLANPAARSATPQITVVSGVLCAYRRGLEDNPSFAGLDADGHRGCSFCTCATMPAVTSTREDPLPLIEAQLRAVLATAGKAGRNKGRFEFFDIRAFWRFDELFRLVLRLKLPPSIFLFNPRIDDVLRRRERIERVLPALAKAGHEVRMLSMGVENFAPAENERFNKRIGLAQFDAFLALVKGWEARHPGVLRPFKDGRSPAELGFILFTPWTTPADLRLNLEAAAARGFPARGYWLYSTLLVEAKAPIFRLAEKDGLLTDAYPDKGQYYGLFKNEGELREVRPWRFRDARTAELFALLVRVSAADREGASCAHFKGDALFALAAALVREANAPPDGSAAPLAIALELLELLEKARPPFAREALLREAVARAAAKSAAARRASAPARARSRRGTAVARVVELLRAERPASFAGLDFESVADAGPGVLRLSLRTPDRRFEIDLFDALTKKGSFLRSRRFAAAYHADAAPPSPRQRKQLAQFLRLIDAAVEAGMKRA